jgi:hypothetical protein
MFGKTSDVIRQLAPIGAAFRMKEPLSPSFFPSLYVLCFSIFEFLWTLCVVEYLYSLFAPFASCFQLFSLLFYFPT